MQLRSEQETIAWVENMGGLIVYETRPTGNWFERATCYWLGEHRVDEAYLHYTSVTHVSPLAGLQDLTKVSITSTTVSDVSSLSQITNLKQIDLKVTQVRAEQVRELEQALPGCKISYSPEVPSMLENLFDDLLFRL